MVFKNFLSSNIIAISVILISFFSSILLGFFSVKKSDKKITILRDALTWFSGLTLAVAGTCLFSILPLESEEVKVTESFKGYSTCFAFAVNECDFDQIATYYEKGSPIYLEQYNYITSHCQENNIELKPLDFIIWDITFSEGAKAEAIIKTSEEFEVTINGETRIQQSNIWYKAKKAKNSWLLTEIIYAQH